MDIAAAKVSEVPFVDDSMDPPVRGFLGGPAPLEGAVSAEPAVMTDALILTHGAGSNCNSPILVAMGRAFAQAGLTVLRADLPFRQKRPHGPPLGTSAADREGLRNAILALRKRGFDSPQRVFLGGHSYGGRQATMLVAADSALADGLLLLSYPLHPPKRPAQLRTAHFPSLNTPVLFVHGSRDPFGSLAELELALPLIPARHSLLPVEGAGHDLGFGGRRGRAPLELTCSIVATFMALVGSGAENAARA